MRKLLGLTEFNDNYFKFEINDSKYENMLRDSFKNINFNTAYSYFINTNAGSNIGSTKKLSLKLLKSFSNQHYQNFSD